MRDYLDRLEPVLRGVTRAHVYCADPGAYAMLGLLEPMLRTAGIPGAFFVEGWAVTKADPRAVAFSREALRRSTQADGDGRGTDLLLLGAQVDFGRTRQVLDFCRSLGIRTALVFDHWKNFSEHFIGRSGDTGGAVLSDFILLPDEAARTGLFSRFEAHPALAGQLVPERAILFGHPALDASARAIRQTTPAEVQELRRGLDCGCGPLAALLLDPVRMEDGYGYDVASLLEFLARWMPEQRPGTALLVKPHPRQEPPLTQDDLAPLTGRGVTARLCDCSFEPLVAAVDEVWGMTSLALIAARKAGKPVVSFQPGRTEAGREQSNLYLEECVIT